MGTLRTTITRRKLLDGTTKLYPNIVRYSRIKSNDLINYMVSNSSINKATAITAAAALCRVITNYLLNGHTVQIPQLGTLSLRAKTKGVETLDKADASCIKTLRIRFTPVSDTRQACKSVKFRSLLDDTVKMAEA